MTSSAFERLLEKRKRIGRLEKLQEFLKWREDAVGTESLPDNFFGEDIEYDLDEIVEEKHAELTDNEMKELLDIVHPAELLGNKDFEEEEQKAIRREVEREYEESVAVPSGLEQEIERVEAELDTEWEEAESFEEVEDKLQKLVELKREYAEEREYENERYEVFFNQYEPYLDLDNADDILKSLKEDLVDLKDHIDAGKFDGPEFENILSVEEIGEDKHMEFQRQLLYSLGLDPEKTPIENSSHGLEGGHRYSTPTLIDVDKLLPAASKTTVHEGGHQLYRQGLGRDGSKKYLFTPLGETSSHLVDESLARFWENHVGRSREFAEYISPDIKQCFDVEASEEEIADAFYSWMNEFDPDNQNRLEADEVTYHLHILTRFDIERELINGGIEVEDLPEIWEEKTKEYLGGSPEDVLGEEDGILQDPHWFRGKFGYFPQYTLGTMLSAQIYESVNEEVDDLDERIESGDYGEITDWLDREIHQYGKLYPTDELIERATGEELSPEPLLRYLEEKFVTAYDEPAE